MEKLMQYVWQHRLWLPADMKTVDGQRVEVIDQGLLNTNAGPDFFNAKVRIGERLWVGNIEIHVKASDWMRHHHDTDAAYDSVILHVVSVDDMRIHRKTGDEIPQLVMQCAEDFNQRYNEMVNKPGADLPCADDIQTLPHIYITDWLGSLAYERLYRKTDRILQTLQRLDYNWPATVYVTLARALGFSTNSEAFERLAMSVPLHTMMKHRTSIHAIEGLLFGQAGFLDDLPDDFDAYVKRLKQEYTFLSTKFGIQRPEGLGWRMRMRPQNFPHRRIATIAAMIHEGFNIASTIFNIETEEQARQLFNIRLQGYWEDRYNFTAKMPAAQQRALSDTSVTILLINVVVPLLHAYGQTFSDKSRMDRAVDILQGLKAERNAIVTLFGSVGIDCPDAMTSQALIELRNEYCLTRKCLYCRIGHRLLAAKVKP
jgi:hypothetical protein